MSPAYCLPDEVFSEIFLNVLYSADKSSLGDSMDSKLRTIFRTRFILMRVCRVWWDVILKQSHFWSLLPLYITSSLQSLGAPAIGSRRAKGSLQFAAIVHENVHLIHWAIGRPAVDIPRIRAMNISSSDPSVERAIGFVFREFCEHDVNSLGLRELSLHQEQDYLDQHQIPGDLNLTILENSPLGAYFLNILKLLSAFRVSGAEFRWSKVAFSDRLVELGLQRVIIGRDSDLTEFLLRLASSPALRDLKLISVKTFSVDSPTDQRILLPDLSSLLLEDLSYNTLGAVLRTISPGSHRLMLFPTEKSKRIFSLENPEPETITIEQLAAILESVSVDTMLLAGTMDEFDSEWPADERWLTAAELHVLLHLRLP